MWLIYLSILPLVMKEDRSSAYHKRKYSMCDLKCRYCVFTLWGRCVHTIFLPWECIDLKLHIFWKYLLLWLFGHTACLQQRRQTKSNWLPPVQKSHLKEIIINCNVIKGACSDLEPHPPTKRYWEFEIVVPEVESHRILEFCVKNMCALMIS